MSPVFELSLGAWRLAPDPVALLAVAGVGWVALHTAWRAGRRLARSGAPRRWGVIALNLVAGGAVALLLLAPSVQREVDATVTLLTEGAESASGAQSDTWTIGSGSRFSLGLEAGSTGSARADWSADPLITAGQLPLRRADMESITVLGHGLEAAQWRSLPADLAVRFDPPALNGPVQVQWAARLALGQALTVSGVLRLETPDSVARLELVDPAGGVVASASARSGQPFALTSTPRGVGALEYRLRVLRGDQPVSDDPVGVSVVRERGARLLVVQSAPSFETRQLANWAADTGQALVIHSRISRDRDLVQGINLEADAPLERSAALYANTDLVLMDGRRWAGLPAGERETLWNAVDAGLGLVLLADAELADWLDAPDNASRLGLGLAPAPAGEPVWPSWTGLVPEQPLPIVPFRLELKSARALTRDENGRLLEAWQPLGEGRVLVSLLRERHRWATSGENSTFTRYWARLLRRIAREDPGPEWLSPPADERPRPGQRLTLCARGDGSALGFGPMGANATSDIVPFVAHATGAEIRCGVVWPTHTGWHVARLLDAEGRSRDELLLRVYGAEHWAAHRHARRQVASRARASSVPDEARASRRQVEMPLSPWWAWSLLLLSASALWLERRLFDLH